VTKQLGRRENDGALEVLLLLGGPTVSARKSGRMKQIIRELKRQVAGEKLELEQLKGLIRAGYVYRNGEEHLLTDMGRDALAQPGVYPSADAPPAPGSNARAKSVAWPDALFHLGR
jgi:hypothetical protein